MILATLPNGIIGQPSPGARGTCPGCKESVIAKCGDKVSWHWAHERDADCDSWAEHETAWHLNWKRQFPPEWCEVPIGEHRTDIRIPRINLSVEVQHSSISSVEILERRRAYGNLAWIVDASGFSDRLYFAGSPEDDEVTLEWRKPRKSWMVASSVYLGMGGDFLFYVCKWDRLLSIDEGGLYKEQYLRAVGRWYNRRTLIDYWLERGGAK